MTFLGRLLKVTVARTRATYQLVEGRPLRFEHFGDEVRLDRRAAVSRPNPRLARIEEPKQPAGREPVGRAAGPPHPLRENRHEESRAPATSPTGGKAA